MAQTAKVEWSYEREDNEYAARYGVDGKAIVYRDKSSKCWRAVATYGTASSAEAERWRSNDVSTLFPQVEAWLQKHLA